MHKTSLITRPPHELQTHVSNVYSTSTTNSMSKTELLIFFSNTLFCQVLLDVQAKYYKYPWLFTFPHIFYSIHQHILLALLLKHMQISKIKYWWKKVSRIWPTTFHHIYCHHHGASHQSLLDYYKNYLTGLSASIFALYNLTLSLS